MTTADEPLGSFPAASPTHWRNCDRAPAERGTVPLDNRATTVVPESYHPPLAEAPGPLSIVRRYCVFHTAVATLVASMTIAFDVAPVPEAPSVPWSNAARVPTARQTAAAQIDAYAVVPGSCQPAPDAPPS